MDANLESLVQQWLQWDSDPTTRSQIGQKKEKKKKKKKKRNNKFITLSHSPLYIS
jgi:hypothetical protein